MGFGKNMDSEMGLELPLQDPQVSVPLCSLTLMIFTLPSEDALSSSSGLRKVHSIFKSLI